MKTLGTGFAVSAFLACAAFQAGAADFPTRPITIVIPYAPGGAPDLIAREMGPKLTAILGQNIVVDNKPGAGGNIGAAFVAKSAPDGYTVLMATQPMVTINPFLFKSMGYEVKDLEPITTAVNVGLVAAVNSSNPAKNLQEFVQFAKTNRTSYGTSGVGTPMHLAGLRLNKQTGIQMEHIAYRGAVQNITDLLGNSIQLSIVDFASAKPFADDGKIRILGVGDKNRLPSAPNIPSLGESIPNFEISSWFAFFGRAGTPKDVIQKLEDAMRQVLNEPDFKAKLLSRGIVSRADGSAALRKLVDDDTALFSKELRDNSVTIEQ
jgi:tripartite-type tricarboxylate transporter receptor subunit TctC